MDRRQLIIVAGVVLLGLLLAFPLTWMFGERSSPTPPPAVRGTNRRAAIHYTDAGGTEWMLTQTGGLPAPKDANGVQTKPIIVVQTDVRRAREREMLIGLVLAGPEGQRYSPVVVKAGMSRAAPRLRIVNEAGKVVLDDSFRYG